MENYGIKSNQLTLQQKNAQNEDYFFVLLLLDNSSLGSNGAILLTFYIVLWLFWLLTFSLLIMQGESQLLSMDTVSKFCPFSISISSRLIKLTSTIVSVSSDSLYPEGK